MLCVAALFVHPSVCAVSSRLNRLFAAFDGRSSSIPPIANFRIHGADTIKPMPPLDTSSPQTGGGHSSSSSTVNGNTITSDSQSPPGSHSQDNATAPGQSVSTSTTYSGTGDGSTPEDSILASNSTRAFAVAYLLRGTSISNPVAAAELDKLLFFLLVLQQHNYGNFKVNLPDSGRATEARLPSQAWLRDFNQQYDGWPTFYVKCASESLNNTLISIDTASYIPAKEESESELSDVDSLQQDGVNLTPDEIQAMSAYKTFTPTLTSCFQMYSNDYVATPPTNSDSDEEKTSSLIP